MTPEFDRVLQIGILRSCRCAEAAWSSCRDNDIGFEPDELGHEVCQTIGISVRPPIFNGNIAPLDPTELAQSLHKSRGHPALCRSRIGAQKPNDLRPSHRLRTRRSRPRGR